MSKEMHGCGRMLPLKKLFALSTSHIYIYQFLKTDDVYQKGDERRWCCEERWLNTLECFPGQAVHIPSQQLLVTDDGQRDVCRVPSAASLFITVFTKATASVMDHSTQADELSDI